LAKGRRRRRPDSWFHVEIQALIDEHAAQILVEGLGEAPHVLRRAADDDAGKRLALPVAVQLLGDVAEVLLGFVVSAALVVRL
jgi:hypothetical protein